MCPTLAAFFRRGRLLTVQERSSGMVVCERCRPIGTVLVSMRDAWNLGIGVPYEEVLPTVSQSSTDFLQRALE